MYQPLTGTLQPSTHHSDAPGNVAMHTPPLVGRFCLFLCASKDWKHVSSHSSEHLRSSGTDANRCQIRALELRQGVINMKSLLVVAVRSESERDRDDMGYGVHAPRPQLTSSIGPQGVIVQRCEPM